MVVRTSDSCTCPDGVKRWVNGISCEACGKTIARTSKERLRELRKTVEHYARTERDRASDETVAELFEVAALLQSLESSDETPVHLTQSTLDSLIAEADKYMLPVDVKMGAATFRKGVKVGTMLRGLKTHAERQTAEAWNPQPNCRFDEHAETCDWIGCPNNSPGSPTHCPLPWPRAELKANVRAPEVCGCPYGQCNCNDGSENGSEG